MSTEQDLLRNPVGRPSQGVLEAPGCLQPRAGGSGGCTPRKTQLQPTGRLPFKEPQGKGQTEGPRVPRPSQHPESARRWQLSVSTSECGSKETGWAGGGQHRADRVGLLGRAEE